VKTDKYLLGRKSFAYLSESSLIVMRIAWLNVVLLRTALIVEYGVFKSISVCTDSMLAHSQPGSLYKNHLPEKIITY